MWKILKIKKRWNFKNAIKKNLDVMEKIWLHFWNQRIRYVQVKYKKSHPARIFFQTQTSVIDYMRLSFSGIKQLRVNPTIRFTEYMLCICSKSSSTGNYDFFPVSLSLR